MCFPYIIVFNDISKRFLIDSKGDTNIPLLLNIITTQDDTTRYNNRLLLDLSWSLTYKAISSANWTISTSTGIRDIRDIKSIQQRTKNCTLRETSTNYTLNSLAIVYDKLNIYLQ